MRQQPVVGRERVVNNALLIEASTGLHYRSTTHVGPKLLVASKRFNCPSKRVSVVYWHQAPGQPIVYDLSTSANISGDHGTAHR